VGVPDVRQALRVNGRLCWDPTDVTTGTYPFGGVGLGIATGKAHRIRSETHVVRAEEWANKAVDAIQPGEEHIFSAVLRAWDTDAIAALFLDRADGATTGRELIKDRVNTDGVRAGTMMSTLAGILYFSPNSDSDPGVIFYNAIPMRPDQSETAYHLAEQWGLPRLWLGTPDASGRDVFVGLRKDITI
jgi:hypothetical protein